MFAWPQDDAAAGITWSGGHAGGKPLFDLVAMPHILSSITKDAKAVHDFLHAMLQTVQVALLLYVTLASTIFEDGALTYFR